MHEKSTHCGSRKANNRVGATFCYYLMKTFKSVFFVLALLCSGILIQAQQTFNFSTSNHNQWTVLDLAGNNVGVFPVGDCLDDCIIQCVCGPTYPTPHTPTCGTGVHVDPIWGENASQEGTLCNYTANRFFFQTTIEIDECESVSNINWQIVADNHFVLRVNGTVITASGILFPSTTTGTFTNWENEYTITNTQASRFNYNATNPNFTTAPLSNNLDIASLFQTGTNVIEVEVRNGANASCINYAFLAMCGSVTTQSNIPDPSFDAAIFPSNNLTIDVTGTVGGGAQHQWLVYEGPTASGPWTLSTTLPGPFTYNGPFPTALPLNAASGVHYLVVHRVNIGNCAACCEVSLRYDNNFQTTYLKKALCGPSSCGKYPWNLPSKRVAAPSMTQGDPVIQLTPNPVSDRLTIASSETIKSGSIVDVNGRIVMEKVLTEESESFSVDVNHLAPGVYFIQLQTTQGKVEVQKFVVKKER